MSTPPNPMLDQNNALMQQSQQTMNNPMTGGVPQPSPISGIANHPVIQAIVQGLAHAMQNIGFAGAAPEQRLAGQQMENQKAETMARLAQTGAYQMGSLGISQQKADTGDVNAATRLKDVNRRMSMDEFTQGMRQQVEADKVEHNKALEALGQGRIDESAKRNDAYLQSVKNRYEIAEQNVGLGAGKLAVQQDLANILRYRSALEGVSVAQRGTQQGVQAEQELAKMETDHWLQNLVGMGGFPRAQGAVNSAVPLPGATTPTGTAPSAGPALGGPPEAPTTAAPVQTPKATNKIQAKRNQKQSQSQGIKVIRDANGKIIGIQ